MEMEASGSRDDPALRVRKIKKNELFIVLRKEQFCGFSSLKCNERLADYIVNKFSISEVSEQLSKQIKNVIKVFVTKLLTKWRDCNYMYERFNKKHVKWLDGDLEFSEMDTTSPTLSVPPPRTLSTRKQRGRPKKLFADSSERSKQRNVKLLVSNLSSEQLCSAAESSLIKSGKRTAAQVVKLTVDSTPKRLKKMKQVHDTTSSATITPYTPDEALALIVDLGLTKEDYITMRLGAKKRGADIYPSYHVVAEAKKNCYPVNIKITENEASVPVQDLLDLSIQRLVQVQSEVILQNTPTNCYNIEVFYKWGLDGSGGHSIYKQNFSNNSNYADSNIILCTIVPLEMSIKDRSNKKILWKNMTPSSTRYSRPITFKLKKENNSNMKEEYAEVEKQIVLLKPTNIMLGDKEIKFVHIPICTMLDGKTVNVLTDTLSTQACNVCKATPKIMNNIQEIKKRFCDESTYKYGISVLHAYLRCYEYLLHISYKLEHKQWQARGAEAQKKVKERKDKIRNDFYKQMGLVVDQPKQGGGNSNDGNTARQFFKNPLLVSQITGIDKDLIERFSNILCLISCGHYVNEESFEEYCLETAKRAVTLYEWYHMSASVHKLLIYGAAIIKSLPLPVGQLSEDVLEAGHKTYKHLRQFYSRKTSRINTNSDIFHWMLVSSDPVVTDCRKKPKNTKGNYNQTIIGMLRLPTINISEEVHDDDDDDQEEVHDNDDDHDDDGEYFF